METLELVTNIQYTSGLLLASLIGFALVGAYEEFSEGKIVTIVISALATFAIFFITSLIRIWS